MAVKVEDLTYECMGVELTGKVAYDDAGGPRPAILVIHTAWGLSRYEIERAEALAELGHTVFATNLYAPEVPEPTNDDEAIATVTGLMMLPDGEFPARLDASLAALRAHPAADATRVAGMGYCLGGTALLNMARAGAEFTGIVSLHGGLSRMPGVEPMGETATKFLLLHGWDDPYAPPATVTSISEELSAVNADWQLVAYGGVGHAFADPYKTYTTPGVFFHEATARRSWATLTDFLGELFPTD